MSVFVYEVRVAGEVAEQELRDLGVVAASPNEVTTILFGIPDQAALHGLLARLGSLGVEVVEVRRVREPDPGKPIPADPREGPRGS